MYFLKWKKEYNTNVTVVDYQHRRLFSSYNKTLKMYFDNYEDTYKDMVTGLICYSKYHFKTEEIAYKIFNIEYSEHKKKHEEFINYVNKINTNVSHKQIDLETLNYFRDWLLIHIIKDDIEMFKQLEMKGLFCKIKLNIQLTLSYIKLKIFK